MEPKRVVDEWLSDGISITQSFPQMPTAESAERHGGDDESHDALSYTAALALIQQQRREIELLQGTLHMTLRAEEEATCDFSM